MVGDTQRMEVTIILENGSLNRPDGAYAQTVAFDRYQINIPLRLPNVNGGKDISQQSTASMTMEQLRRNALLSGDNSQKGREMLVHYHKRITLPAGCFILSLLALPLGLQARVGRGAIGIPLGLGFFILYYILFTVGKNLAQETSVPVAMAMWLPNFFFLVLTLILLRQTTNERPLIPPVLSNGVSALIAEYGSPVAERLVAKLRALMRLPPKTSPGKPPEAWRYEQKREELLGPGHLRKGSIHGDAHTMQCHIPGCASYNCPHCTIEFKNLEIAMQAGFQLCDACETIRRQRGVSQDHSTGNDE
jgi:lipopolysaccharide export system permease protein